MIDSDKLLQKGIELHQSGRLAEAEAQFRRVLESQPACGPALGHLGALLRQQNRVPEAAEQFRRICQLQPGNVNALLSFGVCLGMLGRIPEAAATFREAVRIAPSLPAAHANLSNALLHLGHYAEAEQECRRTIALQPADATSHSNLAAILVAMGRYADAADAARAGLAIRADLPDGYFNLGVALRAMRQLPEARDAFQCAVDLRPNYPAAQAALVTLIAGFGEATLAAATVEAALKASPDNAELHNVAGWTMQLQWRVEDAIAHYRRSDELNPAACIAGSNALLALHYLDQPDSQILFDEHLRWAQRHSIAIEHAPHAGYANNRSPERPLRVAYLSPDFRYHAVAHYLLPIIERHDRRNFEVVCYSGVTAPDGWTQAFREMNVIWRDMAAMSDEQLARQIRADAIDIAIDCSGHTSGHRLLALARRPAPVQVTFLGYPDTIGMTAIDYRITDAVADPPSESDRLNTEQLVRLAPTAWCFAAPSNAPACQVVREPGPIRFGSFTTLAKLTPRWVGVWSDILNRVADSRLLLKSSSLNDANVRQRLLDCFGSHGIDENRVELVQRQVSASEHLGTYHRVDIALDTFPYHGTTTTCEALYMGVPVITLAGRIHASRVGASLLSAVGLTELVAHKEREYVEIAVALAGNPSRLQELHATLRARMESSPLMDASAYVAGLERAYRKMWEAWCISGS